VLPAAALQQCEAILQVAASEVEAACNEVGLQQQLQELESLILQRGLMGTDRYYHDPLTFRNSMRKAP
jgi:hypothetical protein